MFGRKKIAMIVAEFVGTFTLATVVLVVSRQIELSYFTAIAAGAAVGVMVLALGAVSGAHLNPAVTVGMWTLKKIQTTQAVVYVLAQMLGGAFALAYAEYLLRVNIRNQAGSEFDARVFVAEVVGTLIFTFGIAAAVYQGYEGLRKAVTVGASLTAGILVASLGSLAALNPAVAMGINAWSFTYIAAPIVGAILGMNLYAQLLAPSLPGVKQVRKRK